MKENLSSSRVEEALRLHLHEPVEYILSRPSKGLRSRLVELGCKLVISSDSLTVEQKRRCVIASSLVERIHAGSLIVDDIEDNSSVRREFPTLHLKYGIGRALNAGNWLYFSPLTTLKFLQLSAENELQLHRDCLETLSLAHCGQALDLGIRIDEVPQIEVPQLCFSSLEWKTGELVGLAFRLGGYAANADSESRDRLHSFGKELGVGLQMLDDVGNFAMDRSCAMSQKRLEDLRQRRPSWIWSFAATNLQPEEYADWIAAVLALPDETNLQIFENRHQLARSAKNSAFDYLRTVHLQLQSSFPNSAVAHGEALSFIKTLEKAYD